MKGICFCICGILIALGQGLSQPQTKSDTSSIESLITIGKQLSADQHIDSALTVFEEAALVAEKSEAKELFLTANIESIRALMAKREYPAALERSKKAHDRFNYDEADSVYYNFYSLYVESFDRMLQYDEVIPLLHRLIELNENYDRSKNDLISQNGRLAMVYGNLGLMDEAKKYLRKTIDLVDQHFDGQHPDLAKTYNNLGIIYKATGNYETAISYYNKTLQNLKETGMDNPRVFAIINNNIARVYSIMKRHEKALDIMERVMELDPSETNRTLYNSHGLMYIEKGEPEKALDILKKAIEISETKTGPDHPYLTYPRLLLGEAMLKCDRYDEAISNFKEALRVDSLAERSQSVDRAGSLEMWGDALRAQGKFIEAIHKYNSALSVYYPNITSDSLVFAAKNKMEYSQSIDNTSDIFKKLGKLHLEQYTKEENQLYLEKALEYLVLACDQVNVLRHSVFDYSVQTYFAKKNKDLYESAIKAAYDLHNKTNEDKYVFTALRIMESNKAFNLSRELKFSEGTNSTYLPDSVKTRIKKYRGLDSFYKGKLERSDKMSEQDRAELNEKKFQNDVKLKEIEESLKLNHPQFYHALWSTISNDNLVQFQKRLASSSMLLEYFIGENDIYSIGLTKNSISFSTKSKNDDLENYLALRSNKIEEFIYAASKYYDLLLADHFKVSSDMSSLTIIPDGVLSYVPFEVLISSKEKGESFRELDYLLRKYNVLYNYSINILQLERSESEPEEQLLAYAPKFKGVNNPLLATRSAVDSVAYNLLEQLPAAQVEAKYIANLFDGVVNSGESATESHFKKNAVKARYIHMASHSLINDKSPLFSKLVMTPDTDKTEDGLLHTYELYNMSFSAELVSLSACNTGIGEYHEGEGPISLARGFMYAGVPNIAMSVWSVPDQSTAQIMKNFYKKIHDGEDISQALRLSKLEYLNDADEAIASPYHWAGFMLIGQSSAKSDSNIPVVWLFVLAGIMMTLSIWFLYRKLRKS